jgi:hypothetical protein
VLVGVLLLFGFEASPSVAAPDHEGFRRIAWTLYPEEPLPGPRAKSIVVAVHERNCAGGRDPIRYLQHPEIDYLRKRVIVSLWIEKIEGAATCPSNPVGRLKVRLPGPLGGRRLYDGSSNPPRRVKPGEDPQRLPGWSSNVVRVPAPPGGAASR